MTLLEKIKSEFESSDNITSIDLSEVNRDYDTDDCEGCQGRCYDDQCDVINQSWSTYERFLEDMEDSLKGIEYPKDGVYLDTVGDTVSIHFD